MTNSNVRSAVVAGRFYPESSEDLTRSMQEFGLHSDGSIPACGIVSPHAGYRYSGAVAADVFSLINVPDTVVILCPNHTGMGSPFSLWDGASWETPLGKIDIDTEFAEFLLKEAPFVRRDRDAHRKEHAIEVQLPFIQICNPNARIVPIVVGSSRFDELSSLGSALARAAQSLGNRVLVIASSDMTHYEPHDRARERDKLAIDRILGIDPEGLYNTVHDRQISMCGYGPAAAMLTFAQDIGASKADLVKYQTSGEVSGDYDSVVGYAGVIVV